MEIYFPIGRTDGKRATTTEHRTNGDVCEFQFILMIRN